VNITAKFCEGNCGREKEKIYERKQKICGEDKKLMKKKNA
jgi:hypothetical protein